MSSQPPTPDYTRESKSASEATPKYYIDPLSTRRPLIQRTFIGTSPLEDYVIERKLGEGTFGEVHKARHIKTRRAVALKRILMHNEKEGIPITAIREIKILKALCHKNVLSLLDMAFVPGEKNSPRRASIYMVTPYMDHDLSGLIENPAVRFTLPQIKCYMNQLLEGMWYLHNNNIIHRDIKAANLLISNEGILKIADFGLARPCESPEAEYTGCVVTRWYRPPELLLGQKKYTPAIDMWGVGCVFGQMLLSKPLIPGKSDIEQLDLIFRLCGSPTEETMPGFRELPGCEGVENFPSYSRRIKDQFSSIDQYCVDLLDKLLILDPKKRYTASDALSHKVFFMDPLPATPSSLPSYESSHEYDRHGFREEVKKPFRNQPDRSPSNHHRRSRQPMNRKPYDNNSNRSSQGSSWRNSRPLGRGNGRKDDGVNPWSKNSIDPKRYPPTAESRTSHNNWS